MHDGLLFVEGVPGKDLRIRPRAEVLGGEILAGGSRAGGTQVSLGAPPPVVDWTASNANVLDDFFSAAPAAKT